MNCDDTTTYVYEELPAPTAEEIEKHLRDIERQEKREALDQCRAGWSTPVNSAPAMRTVTVPLHKIPPRRVIKIPGGRS